MLGKLLTCKDIGRIFVALAIGRQSESRLVDNLMKLIHTKAKDLRPVDISSLAYAFG